MMRFEYAMLRAVDDLRHYRYIFEHNGEQFKYGSLLEALNTLGYTHWQLVSREELNYILMRETK